LTIGESRIAANCASRDWLALGGFGDGPMPNGRDLEIARTRMAMKFSSSFLNEVVIDD
jgi:hypothetical protein